MILSLDLSTKSSGWALYDNKELKDYGCITSASTDLIKRIHIMIDNLKEIIEKNNIDKIIVEEVRPDNGINNIKTMKALMYLQAALEFLIHDNFNNIEIIYIYPSSWRSVCGITTGRGVKRITLKEADIAFVKNKFNIEVNDDIADSICIGYAYLNPEKEVKELNWGE